MVLCQCSTPVRSVLQIAGDLVRFVSAAVRSHAQLAAENLFLRKQLALYVERQAKPRRADDATRMALVALSWLIDWRRVLTVVKPDTLVRWHRKGFRLFWHGNHPHVADVDCPPTCNGSSRTWPQRIEPGAKSGSPPNGY
jgi:hypothetical protein